MLTCSLPTTTDAQRSAEREAQICADALGSLLFDAPEFQTYLLRAHAANQDEQARALRHEYFVVEYNSNDDDTLDELTARLEALPVMQSLRQAECDLRSLCAAIDACITDTCIADACIGDPALADILRLPFAETASAGCG